MVPFKLLRISLNNQSRTSLCLLVYNELPGCQIDVPCLPRHLFSEIYAIDGGSTDGTVEYLSSQGIPVYRQPKRSLNAAYDYAVEKCTGEAIIVFFPKGTIAPECIERILQQLEAGYALVVASRNISGGHNEEDVGFIRPRKWGTMALSLFTALIWRREGWRIRDILHGVKGFTLDAYRRMNVSDTGVTVDLEMTVRAYRLRLSRIEIPVNEVKRPSGTTRFKIWPTGKRLLAFLGDELFRRFP
jgi:glycosyltransferase involved in cell wall biosynthesis